MNENERKKRHFRVTRTTDIWLEDDPSLDEAALEGLVDAMVTYSDIDEYPIPLILDRDGSWTEEEHAHQPVAVYDGNWGRDDPAWATEELT